MNQLRLFLRLYFRPHRAFGPVIDESRLAFAVGLALLAMLSVQAPRQMEYRRITERVMRYAGSLSPSTLNPNPDASPVPPDPPTTEELRENATVLLSMIGPMTPWRAVDRFIGSSPTNYFPPLIALALCFIPAAILAITILQGLGRFTHILFRDYLALLMCGLLAFAAAYLPLGIVNSGLRYLHPQWHNAPVLWWVAQAWFLVLTLFAIRTIMGANVLHAAGAVAGGWLSGVSGIWLHSMAGNVTWYLASPCVLWYLWQSMQGPMATVGYGLSSRQRLKRNLETLTINPRDADAHVQLGHVYLQRRQYEPAAESFRKAVEIDASEPDAHYQLGRMARLEGRYAEALDQCQTAARLDDKHSGSEVWRELGVVQFLSGRHEAARYALEKFIARREYDPEGQCWYGRVLAAVGDVEGARLAFANAIEAARTMPAPRKYQVGCWASDAAKEARALPKPAANAKQGQPSRIGASSERELSR